VVAPAYVVVSQKPGDPEVLRVIMDSRDADEQQNFQALITRADGGVEGVQLGVDGLSWSFAPSAPPTSVRLLLGVYGVTSAALPLSPAAGYLVHYRFVPNDLGKVAFRGAPATITDDGLALDFHGGVIKFRRVRR